MDDYFFAALLKAHCDAQLQIFLEVCAEIQFPIAMEKTFYGSTQMTFLGMLLDMVAQVVCIPEDKIVKARELIEQFLNRNKKKVTVHQIQKLCGVLNFLCHCIVPGRVFTRCLYSSVSSKLKPHHHIRISQEMRMDLAV